MYHLVFCVNKSLSPFPCQPRPKTINQTEHRETAGPRGFIWTHKSIKSLFIIFSIILELAFHQCGFSLFTPFSAVEISKGSLAQRSLQWVYRGMNWVELNHTVCIDTNCWCRMMAGLLLQNSSSNVVNALMIFLTHLIHSLIECIKSWD